MKADLLPSTKRKESDPKPEFTEGDRVRYTTESGVVRTGTVIGKAPVRGVIGVTLDGDPFGTCLSVKRMVKESSSTSPQQYQDAGSGGNMATKQKAAKGKADKAKPEKKASSSNGSNPYREGSSMAFLFEELVKGGKAGDIGRRMAKKFPVKVRADAEDPDAHVQAEAVQRTLDVLKAAEKAGLKTEKEGRGAEAVCKIVV